MRLKISFLVVLISFGKLSSGHPSSKSRHEFLKASEVNSKGRVVLNFNINVFGNGSVSGRHGEEINGKDVEKTQAATIALNVRKFEDSKTDKSSAASQQINNARSTFETNTNNADARIARNSRHLWNSKNAQSANIAGNVQHAVDAQFAGNVNRDRTTRNVRNARNVKTNTARRAENAPKIPTIWNANSAANAPRQSASGTIGADSAHSTVTNARNAANAQMPDPAQIAESRHSSTWTAALNARRAANAPDTSSGRVGTARITQTAPKPHLVNDPLSATKVQHAGSSVNSAPNFQPSVMGQNDRKANSVDNARKVRKRSRSIPKSFLLEFSTMCHGSPQTDNSGSITLKEVERSGERSWESGLKFLKSGEVVLASGGNGCYKAYYFKIPRNMRVSFVEVVRKKTHLASVFGYRSTLVVVSHRNVLYFYNQSPFFRRGGPQRVSKCSLYCGHVPKKQVEKLIRSLE